MAGKKPTQPTDQTQQTPDREILTALVRRLRIHAQRICNAQAKRTVGLDMVEAANAIEYLLDGISQAEAAAASMVALLGREGYAAYVGEDRQ